MSKKIALALSGGVDSSTAAYLLKQSGDAQISAVYCRFWARNPAEKRRIDAEAISAAAIAKFLNIDFQILDYAKEQKELVVDKFIQAYQAGDSPNPCLTCNRDLKFGLLLDWALANGFDYLATGHYAQIIEEKDQIFLASALDSQKDQSYFLYQLTEAQLKHLLFPLGKLKKSEVRQIASEAGLKITQRESFDVCFLNQLSLKKFLEQNLVQRPGNIVDQAGLVLGQHQGLAFYTIGQRQGFQVDHRALKNSQVISFDPNSPPALYVIAKNQFANELIVGEQNDCFQKQFYLRELHFINHSHETAFTQQKKLHAQVKVRNTSQFFNCQLSLSAKGKALVSSSEDIFALAPGQAAVFYQDSQLGAKVLAGAIIDKVAAAVSKNNSSPLGDEGDTQE